MKYTLSDFNNFTKPINKLIKFSFFQSILDADLQALGDLEYLDLSRNLIKEIIPGTFTFMPSLKGLDFSVNVVRKVCFR